MNGFNYPQTEVDRKHPTTVMVAINDLIVGEAQLPDDPADVAGCSATIVASIPAPMVI